MPIKMFYLGASLLTAAISCIKQLREGMPSDVSERSPYLLVTIVNLSESHRLKVEDTWFQSGGICSPQLFDSILPRSSITVFACSNDSAIATGVSGGIGLRVYQNGSSEPFTSEGKDWWICTFSSHGYGGSKQCLMRWKDHGIPPLWKEMQNAHHVNDPLCGCHQKDANHIVFTWKGAPSNR